MRFLPAPAGLRSAPRGPVPYRRSWRELLSVYRRPLAAALAALAVASALAALAPERAEKVPVVVAARELPTGAVVGAGDVELVELAEAALPPDLIADPARVAGSQLAVPLAAGSPVSEAMLVGPGLLTGTRPGTVAVPVHPSDPETVALLSPGQLVDVVLSEGNGYERPVESTVLARRVPVLWVPTGNDAGAWLGGQGASTGGMVVLGADREQSAELAGAGTRGRIFLVLVAAEGPP
ncbi:Flp pilus assembly protein CpaB [Zafaria sp. Z1313]|uniref:Flp pilus assembly protein CpaB n=1 Tax=unclassified Zafaria TaxID=2828765 RepID=UPI002E7959BA|nr:Flp pilus assembly protein CpaB [Zafaria sp. J156]MEE1620454.1 Flp pilus assembly protein CpaB [Zafaria sp. J156]